MGLNLKSGFTLRAFVALVYSVIVFQPAIIWSNLAVGIGIGSISWITLLFFEVFGRLTGKPLSKQEAFIIMQTSGIAMIATTFVNLVYRAYFVNSPTIGFFNLAGQIPAWWVPLEKEVWISRTFFVQPWLVPIALVGVNLFLLTISDIVMGIIARQIFVENLDLPFPMQQVSAEAVITISERNKKKMNYILIGIGIGFIYALGLYGIPFLTEIFGYVGQIGNVPIPWADFNAFVHTFLPGAAVGIATDLMIFSIGFIIPARVIVSVFATSVAIYVFGNHFLVQYGLTEFSSEFFRGMSIGMVMQRSTLYVWAGPLLGIAFAAGLLPLLHNWRSFVDAVKSLGGTRSSGNSGFSLWLLIGTWLAVSIASVVMVYFLVPAYPIWIMLIFSLGWSFFWTLTNSRAIGVTGAGIPIPGGVLRLAKFSYISITGYGSADIWFADPVISLGGADWCATFKVAQLCETTPRSYIKAYLVMLPIALVTGFIYVQNFWWAAKLPSVTYPATATLWPVQAINEALLYSGNIFRFYDVTWILGPFGIVALIYIVSSVLHLPISVIGIAAGAATPPPYAFSYFIGSIVNVVLARALKERWTENKRVIVAGLAFGNAIVIVVFSTLVMLLRSLWALPY